MNLVPASSFAALLAVVTLSLSVRRTLARIKVLESQRNQALATIDTQRALLDGLVPLMTAVRATLAPCPHCDLGTDEPCLCQARRRALLAAFSSTEEALAHQRPAARRSDRGEGAGTDDDSEPPPHR